LYFVFNSPFLVMGVFNSKSQTPVEDLRRQIRSSQSVAFEPGMLHSNSLSKQGLRRESSIGPPPRNHEKIRKKVRFNGLSMIT
jgi:hypothetical protein